MNNKFFQRYKKVNRQQTTDNRFFSIPQFLNSSIPQFLNSSIPQFLSSSIPQFLNKFHRFHCFFNVVYSQDVGAFHQCNGVEHCCAVERFL